MCTNKDLESKTRMQATLLISFSTKTLCTLTSLQIYLPTHCTFAPFSISFYFKFSTNSVNFGANTKTLNIHGPEDKQLALTLREATCTEKWWCQCAGTALTVQTLFVVVNLAWHIVFGRGHHCPLYVHCFWHSHFKVSISCHSDPQPLPAQLIHLCQGPLHPSDTALLFLSLYNYLGNCGVIVCITCSK